MSNFNHIMVDLETLGTKSNSVIISLGAVQFNPVSGETQGQFYRNISVQSQLDRGLTVDGSTIKFWLAQEEGARKNLFKDEKDIIQVLRDFQFWCFITLCKNEGRNFDDFRYWGNGSKFDLGLLTNAYEKCQMEVFWKHRQERDLRTIVDLCPSIKSSTEFTGIRHYAIDDCLHQIKYLSATLKHLKLVI